MLMFCGWQKTRCKFYCWLIFCQGQASILPSAFLRWFEPATVGSSSIHACARITKNVPSGTFLLLADGEGFEPPEELPLQRFSRPSHSTALPPIRNCFILFAGLSNLRFCSHRVAGSPFVRARQRSACLADS